MLMHLKMWRLTECRRLHADVSAALRLIRDVTHLLQGSVDMCKGCESPLKMFDGRVTGMDRPQIFKSERLTGNGISARTHTLPHSLLQRRAAETTPTFLHCLDLRLVRPRIEVVAKQMPAGLEGSTGGTMFVPRRKRCTSMHDRGCSGCRGGLSMQEIWVAPGAQHTISRLCGFRVKGEYYPGLCRGTT